MFPILEEELPSTEIAGCRVDDVGISVCGVDSEIGEISSVGGGGTADEVNKMGAAATTSFLALVLYRISE